MDFGKIVSGIGSLFQAHPAIAVAVVVGLGVLFYFRPKPMLKLVATLLVFVCLAYVFTLFGDMTVTGYSQKTKMVNDIPQGGQDPASPSGR